MKILVINGPNINLLGTREPEIYGNKTLEGLILDLKEFVKNNMQEVELDFFQSNHEGSIIDKIHDAKDFDGLIINPAGYTHTSVAIADAIKGTGIKAVEVHISNPNAREEYRKISYTSSSCVGVVAGFGFDSYKFALMGLYSKLKNE